MRRPWAVALVLLPVGVSACALTPSVPTAPASPAPTPLTSAQSPAAGSMQPSASASAQASVTTEAPFEAVGLAFVRPLEGVFVIEDGGQVRRVVSPDARGSLGAATSVTWSPDGERLAFSLGVPVTVNIGIVGADGGEPIIVEGASWPDWSPDGSMLAVGTPFDAIGVGASQQLPVAVVDPATGERREIGAGLLPTWHPDGERVVVQRIIGETAFAAGTVTLVAISVADGSEEELVRGPYAAAWSPDGSQVAYTVRNIECAPACEEIIVAPAGGGDPAPLTDGASPSWSPDGRFLAFAALQDNVMHSLVVELATGTIVDLGPSDGLAAGWSSDGSRIAVTSYDAQGAPMVRIVEPSSGRTLVEIAGQGASWRPTD